MDMGAPRLSVSIERTPYGEVDVELPPAPVTSIALHLAGRCHLGWAMGGRPLTARPARGQMTLVPQGRAGQLHVRGGPCEVLKIGVADTAFAAWAWGQERHWDANPLVDRIAVADPLVRQLGLALLTETERPGTVDHIYQDALSGALLAHLVRRHSELEQPRDAPRVHPLSERRARAAVALMEDRLTEAIGLDEIARALGLSTSHFAAQFRLRFGSTPARYLTWLRLDHARVLLETTALPVAEVSRRVGFVSPSHFAQAFGRQFGQPPTLWRRHRS